MVTALKPDICARTSSKFLRRTSCGWRVTTNHSPRHRPRNLAPDTADPFDVTISDEDKDPHLLSKLSEELPGLLRRAVRGCLAWQRDGLIAPRAVTKATERYRIESDLVSQFLDEHCVGEVCAQVRSTVFFAAYQNWCAENGIAHPLSQKALAKRLTEKGYDRGENRQGQALWPGLRILNPEDRTDKDTL